MGRYLYIRRTVGFLLLIVAAISGPSSANAQDYEQLHEQLYESLESIAARSPAEQVELIAKFKSIQRETVIVEMLGESDLRLESLRFKFVGSGSGGGGVGAKGRFGNEPYKSVQEVFDDAELEHRLFFQLLVSNGEEIPAVECPVDDSNAPVVDTGGKPGEAAVELACGVRVVEIRLSGPARAAAAFASEHRQIAELRRWPSAEERQRALQSLQGTQ
jgi:hypothetical protein